MHTCVCAHTYTAAQMGKRSWRSPVCFVFGASQIGSWCLIYACTHLARGAEFLWPSLCVQRFLHEGKSVRVWEREKEKVRAQVVDDVCVVARSSH